MCIILISKQKDLETAVNDTRFNGDFKNILLFLLGNERQTNNNVDHNLVESDTDRLKDSLETKDFIFGTRRFINNFA